MKIEDGPMQPDRFAFGGEFYRIPTPLLWRLINHVWLAPGRRASVDSLAEAVWGDRKHDISYLALASLRRNANRFFSRNNLPFRMRTSQDAVMLLDDRVLKESLNG